MRGRVWQLFETPRFLWGVFIAGLAVILFAGLYQKEGSSRNVVQWSDEGKGLLFEGHGIAFTEPFLEGSDIPADQGMTIELGLRVQVSQESSFRFILHLEAGNPGTQIVVGQWKHHLIVMQGDDYSYERREPRVSTKLADGQEEFLLSIVSGEFGTVLCIDGEPQVRRPDLHLRVPVGERPARLILGNSVASMQPMHGVVRGVAFYPRDLPAETILAHAHRYREEKSFEAFDSDNALLLFQFGEEGGESARGQGTRPVELLFPSDRYLISLAHFIDNPGQWLTDWQLTDDVLVNLLGFIPFGFVLTALLRRRLRWIPALGLAFVIGVLLSLTIETIQAWMPARVSSLLDFILNSAGTMVGGILFVLGSRRWGARTEKDLPAVESPNC